MEIKIQGDMITDGLTYIDHSDGDKVKSYYIKFDATTQQIVEATGVYSIVPIN